MSFWALLFAFALGLVAGMILMFLLYRRDFFLDILWGSPLVIDRLAGPSDG